MSDYISRDKLIEALREWQKTLIETYGENDEYVRCLESVLIGIDSIPAADVRPVVLCRDCIHFQQFRAHDGFCQIDGMLWNNDFFCANGKREES